jgi:hypothetical protein
MQLNDYFRSEGDRVHFSRQQASDFAKNIAGDFNPIHNPDAKRFCVPGDLLFAVALHHYGLSQKMRFVFSGMVTDEAVIFPETTSGNITISDESGKQYLTIEREGETTTNPALINELTRNYVSFSGQTFPHILVPLMERNSVMINPERPLVIYESMVIDMERLDAVAPTLELANSRLDVDGKRGNATLEFNLVSEGEIIGRGAKSMVLSGLREFDAAQVSALVDEYATWKEAYLRA